MLHVVTLSHAYKRASIAVIALLTALTLCSTAVIKAADHRGAPTVDGLPEGDITDVYAFLDPTDASKLVLAMNVNPFAVQGSTPTYRYSPDFLYQFKIDNTGDAVEDLVIQVQFTGNGVPQTVQVFGPMTPSVTGARAIKPGGAPTVTGQTGSILTDTSGRIQVFADLRDDPFVFDFSQFSRILNGSQDVFRAVTSPELGDCPSDT